MKKTVSIKAFLPLMAVLLMGIVFIGCEKDDDDPRGGGLLTMSIDGQHWAADVKGVATFEAERTGEAHSVAIIGSAGEEGQPGYDIFMVAMQLSEAQLNSPNGNYPFLLDEVALDAGEGVGCAFMRFHEDGTTVYAMTDGVMTITGSKLDNLTFMGMDVGRGFGSLTGTFSGTFILSPGEGQPLDSDSETLTVTNGRFNVGNASGFADFPLIPM